MWRKVQSVMVVFFLFVLIAEFWRVCTGPSSVKVHAFIDGTIASYLGAVIIKENPGIVTEEIAFVLCALIVVGVGLLASTLVR